MRKVRVHLLGPYAAYHDGPIEIIANTAWEAIEAVTRQIKGFLPDPIRGRQRIQAVGFPTLESLKQPLEVDEIRIMPSMVFGKRNGVFQTIIGVTLIVVGIAMGGTFWPALFISTGISLTVGGVMQMLSPVPQLNAGNEDAVRSKYLPSGKNTVAIGTTIPLLYGRRICGGHVLSLNIDAKDTGL